MTRYKIKVDATLDVKSEAFGAHVDHEAVFIPLKLAQALEHLPLGDDAVTIAGFIASFPTSVAGSLGLSPDGVIKAVNTFTQLLEDSGADVSSVRHRMSRPLRGARHPGQLDRVRD